jgi:hypothetical protein
MGKELKHLAVTLMQEKPMNTWMAREEDHVVIAAVVVVATFVAVEGFWFPFRIAALPSSIPLRKPLPLHANT